MTKMIQFSNGDDLSQAWEYHVASESTKELNSRFEFMLEYLEKGEIPQIVIKIVDCDVCKS